MNVMRRGFRDGFPPVRTGVSVAVETAGDGGFRAAPAPFAPCPVLVRRQPGDEFPPAAMACDRAVFAALVHRDRPEAALQVLRPLPEPGPLPAAVIPGLHGVGLTERVVETVRGFLDRGRLRFGQVGGGPVEHGEELAQVGELGAAGAVALGDGAVVLRGGPALMSSA